MLSRFELRVVRRGNGARKGSPVTDYSLARRAVLGQFRRGVLTIFDICDAHPELMRAGRHIGRKIDRACPVCGHDSLRQVRYVFGDQLRQLSGRVVYPEDWVLQLSEAYDEFRCYAVEVCVDCSWNHLLACYLLGRRFASTDPGGGRRRAVSSHL